VICRRAFLAGLGLLVAATPVKAGGLLNSFFGAEAEVAYLTAVEDGSNATTYTFSDIDFGVASADRRIIVGVIGRASSAEARTITAASCTIGGVAPSKVVEVAGGTDVNDTVTLLIATVPTGTTGQEVVIVWSDSMNRCAIAVWAATGLASNTATDTATSTASPPSGTIDVPAHGFVVVMASSTTTTSCTATGYTERFDAVIESHTYSGGDYSATSAETGRTITTTFASHDGPIMVAAAFGP
jgi:hypothetical protein